MFEIIFECVREGVKCVWMSQRLSYRRNKIIEIYAGILVETTL